jgi:hypothetical protein
VDNVKEVAGKVADGVEDGVVSGKDKVVGVAEIAIDGAIGVLNIAVDSAIKVKDTLLSK